MSLRTGRKRVKRVSRFGECEICKLVEAKYTCPACEIRTCSLSCSKKHKKELDCEGIRLRTSFVKMSDFGNLNLLSDYRLLDDISCKVDSCHRDKSARYLNYQFQNKWTKLREAVVRRGADLVILPDGFNRHKTNTSIFDFKSRLIKWRVQLTFLNASRFTIYEDKCSEDTLLSKLIEKYVSNNQVFPYSKKLVTYQKLGLDKITVLMKAERIPASDKKFYKLDMGQTLHDNFIGKAIVEFPQLYVALDACYTAQKITKGTSSEPSQRSFFLTSASSSNSVDPYKEIEMNISDSTEDEDDDNTNDGSAKKLSSYRSFLQIT